MLAPDRNRRTGDPCWIRRGQYPPAGLRVQGHKERDVNEIRLPQEVRRLLEAPNYVHLSTLRTDGSPRNHVVWVGLEGDRILVCTSDATWKAKDMRRDPRAALSVIDGENPYRMASLQGRVVEIRTDEDCRYMDPIAIKYTSQPFPSRGPDRVCFVIAVHRAGARSLDWLEHKPAGPEGDDAAR
jgi:PPOX class probable F420-dependent enzyme